MKISFFGHFGTLNTGNEGTLLTVLTRLRALSPEYEFCCICTNPESAAAWYGIEAVPISSRVARIWNRQLPLGKRLRGVPVGLSQELWQYVRAYRTLEGTRMLIVPGTGLLTDAYGLSAWGPYNLFKWSLMAKLRGCRLVFLSVGAGPIHSVPGRLLTKAALSLAEYRSYRDDSSLEYLKGIGFRTNHDRVYPDLVFGLPGNLVPLGRNGAGRRRVVGLGLMMHAGTYSVANPRPETYATYLESLVAFAGWLLEHDYDISLLLGDGDTPVISEFKSLLRARLGTYDEGRVVDRPVESVDTLLSELAATDVVVATRFHNILYALLLDKPVIAISFHHKCSSLMSEMGLSQYCHDINQMDAGRLIEQFQELERNSDELKRSTRERVEAFRRALDEQYDLVLERP